MSVATEAAVSISEIEEKLSELGFETEYVGEDDFTTFTVSVGDKEITLIDAVSGDSFKPENLTHASYYFGDIGKDVTRKFEDVETVEEFVYAVQDCMTVNFLPR
jgi:hypothetical protein